jgi:hypothetical protein
MGNTKACIFFQIILFLCKIGDKLGGGVCLSNLLEKKKELCKVYFAVKVRD